MAECATSKAHERVRGSRRTVLARGAAFCSILFGVALVPSDAAAQLSWGVHLAKANEIDAGVWGGGAHVVVDPPALPIAVVLAGEYFDPECDGCSFLGWSLDVRLGLPSAVIDTYGTLGLASRKFDPGEDLDGEWNSSLAAGAGVAVPIASTRVFVEARYEFVEDDQLVWRIGLTF